MSDYHLGDLGAVELPPNAPLPKKTPANGVILTRRDKDGWTRKYLYRAGLGDDGHPWQKSFLLSELAPRQLSIIPSESVEIQESDPQMGLPAVTMARPMPLKLASRAPMLGNARMGQAFPIGGGTLPSGQPALQQPPATPLPEPLCPVGPMQMADGRLLNPDDPITLADLCVMMPTFAKALLAPPGGRTGLVPLIGQPPGGATPIGGMNPFGSAPGGGGGFGGFGGGGGGPGPQGPAGAAGTAGVTGAAGAGLSTDFVSKTDGDFTAGPGAFIPVPGTLLSFSTPEDGTTIFFIQATLGCDQTQNGALGVRVDGVDYPVNKRLIQTFAAGVEEFFTPSSYFIPITLSAGAHTAEVILRGLVAGSECSASGLGLSQTVSATAETPLTLLAQHSSSAAAPAAAILQVDGVRKTDGNFASAALAPVPGTSFGFTMSIAGMVQVNVNANLSRTPGATIPSVLVGVRIDGTDYLLGQIVEQQGAGGDNISGLHIGGSMPLSLAAGAHTAQMIYAGGAPETMTLEANATLAASVSVIHP